MPINILEVNVVMENFELYDNAEKRVPALPEIMARYNEYLPKIKEWAQIRYPNAGNKNLCSFAGMIMYFATGAYGGYGTESYQKERFAETKAYEFYKNCKDFMEPAQLSYAMIYFLASHILQKAPLEEESRKEIAASIELLEETKSSFKSKQVAEARKRLKKVLI